VQLNPLILHFCSRWIEPHLPFSSGIGNPSFVVTLRWITCRLLPHCVHEVTKEKRGGGVWNGRRAINDKVN